MLSYQDCVELSDLTEEDIEEERRRGHNDKVLKLKLVLKHFVDTHPVKE